MSNIYVKSTTGSDSNSGATVALAKATLSGADAIDVAGDNIYLSQLHNETTAASVTYSIAGTPTTMSKIIAANDAAEPPTTLATAAITSGTNFALAFNGSFYMRGVSLTAGSGTGAISLGQTAGTQEYQHYEACNFALTSTTNGVRITLGNASQTNAHEILWRNCFLKLANAAHGLSIYSDFRWIGGGITTGGTTPTSLLTSSGGKPMSILLDSVDLSAYGAAVNLVATSTLASGTAIFRNIKLPTSWSGALVVAPATGPRYGLYNSYAGSFKYRIWLEDSIGKLRDETTVVRSGGAVDDTTAFSMKIASTANCGYPGSPFEGAPIKTYIATSGSPVTVALEIVHDSQGAGTAGALRNDEIGLQVVYPGGYTETFKLDPLATAADVASSAAATWTTTGLATPVKQTVSATFTNTSKGEASIVPIFFATSKTVYVCPKVTVS